MPTTKDEILKEYSLTFAIPKDCPDFLYPHLSELLGHIQAFIEKSLDRYAQARLEEVIKDISYNHQSVGCGLEDNHITDRYEAAEYGYKECLNQLSQT